jgi:hypothetical protein
MGLEPQKVTIPIRMMQITRIATLLSLFTFIFVKTLLKSSFGKAFFSKERFVLNFYFWSFGFV